MTCNRNTSATTLPTISSPPSLDSLGCLSSRARPPYLQRKGGKSARRESRTGRAVRPRGQCAQGRQSGANHRPVRGCHTGDHLWAEHYDRPLREVFALQDEIVRRIVATANLQLVLVDTPRITKRTDNPDAYDYCLRRHELFDLTREGEEKARQMLEKATSSSTRSYSDAYALLGYVHYMEMICQLSGDAHGFDRSIQLEQKAIALDNSNAGAWAILGESYLSTGRHDLGMAAVERALALEPNSAFGYSALAATLTYSGKPADALVAAQKPTASILKGATTTLAFGGEAYLYMRRYEDAVAALKRAVARYNRVIVEHLDLIACYVELGRNEEPGAEAAEVMRLNSKFSLADQKQMFSNKQPLQEDYYDDLAKAD